MLYPLWYKLTHTSRSVYLLASLILLIFVYPIVADHPVAWLFLGILFAVTPLTGVYAVSDNRKTMVVATVLAVPAILSIFGPFFLDTKMVSDQVFLALIAA